MVDIEVDENVATKIDDVHESRLFIGGETLNIVAPTKIVSSGNRITNNPLL